jgi:3-methyladenine DNA glycosylase AlkC
MEPLKNTFSRPLLQQVAAAFTRVHPDFQDERFFSLVFHPAWEEMELKQRIRHLSLCLGQVLPPNYREALRVVTGVTEQLLEDAGEQMSFPYLFLPDFVETWGLSDPDASLPALATITRWSSAEFAIRPFILQYPDRLYTQMAEWSLHPSPMVRRLSSEGFRPRLPWGMGIPTLKKDPSPILPILENLRNDPAETVRRSVANNLNDISKDHPKLVLNTCRAWLGDSAETDKLLKHACRGLLKNGHPEALGLFGYPSETSGIRLDELTYPKSMEIGAAFPYSFVVCNESDQAMALRIDLQMEYLTSTGLYSKKVFKIKEGKLAAGQRERIQRHRSFADFTIRKHFPGNHRFALIVNGKQMASGSFELVTASVPE